MTNEQHNQAIAAEAERPLTRAEMRRCTETARRTGSTVEAAVAGYRRHLAYWVGSASESVRRTPAVVVHV